MSLALALAAVVAASTCTAASAAVSYPGPGWSFAAPTTGITFRGVPPSRLERLKVTGSRSGRHRGELRALRIGTGTVFTPAKPFQQDEKVIVRAGVRLRGAPKGRFTFRTARRFGAVPNRLRNGGRATEPWRRKLVAPCRFRTRDLRTLPKLSPQDMCTDGRVIGDGRLLVSLKPGGRGGGWAAAIISKTGKLLWYTQAPYALNDLKVITLDGRRLVAYYANPPKQRAYYRLVDEEYETVGRLHMGNGYGVDSHDLAVSARGTVYLGSYNHVWTGPRRRTTEYVIQELDPQTEDVLFEWHSLDHVPPGRTSYRGKPEPGIGWDYFHGNAIQPPAKAGGTILISARNTSAIYAIDDRTGDVRWVLGGRRDELGVVRRHPSWQFCAQHDVRRAPDGDVTLFDNGGARLKPSRCPVHPARLMRFRIDTKRRRATLVQQISSAKVTEGRTAYFPGALGSARLYRAGRALVDWGTTGRVTLHEPDGRVRFRLALRSRSYRAVLARWTGTPSGKPRIAVDRAEDGKLGVWASWNGATEIRQWQVLAAPDRASLAPVGDPVRFKDLETALSVDVQPPGFVAVEAQRGDGTPLGRSRAVGVPGSAPAPRVPSAETPVR